MEALHTPPSPDSLSYSHGNMYVVERDTQTIPHLPSSVGRVASAHELLHATPEGTYSYTGGWTIAAFG